MFRHNVQRGLRSASLFAQKAHNCHVPVSRSILRRFRVPQEWRHFNSSADWTDGTDEFLSETRPESPESPESYEFVLDGILRQLVSDADCDLDYKKVNGLCNDSYRHAYIGEKHLEMVNKISKDFIEYLDEPFNEDANRNDYSFHVIYGVSKSGKSTSMDQIAQKLADVDDNNLVVSMTFNNHSPISLVSSEGNAKTITNEFLIRLLYSLFHKSPSEAHYQLFSAEYMEKLDKVGARKKFLLHKFLVLLEKHNILKENERLILIIDELILTGPGQRKIHPALYDLVKDFLREKPKMGAILSTLDVKSFLDVISPTKNTIVKSYPVPMLTSDEIDELVESRNIDKLPYDDFYNKYNLTELYTRLVQPCLGVMIEICTDSKCLIDEENTNNKARKVKMENLWSRAANLREPASKEVVYAAFDLSYGSLEDDIGHKNVGELLFDGILVQPDKNDIRDVSKNLSKANTFLIKPNLLSVLKYFDSKSNKNPIYKQMMDLLLDDTAMRRIGRSGIIKSGKEFEEIHMMFEALKRNVLFECDTAKSLEKVNIEFDNNNNINKIECIKMKLKDIYTSYASYYNCDDGDYIYLPNITKIVRVQEQFSNSALDNITFDPQSVYIFEGKGENNPGFDLLMSAYSKDFKLYGVFIENKYSYSFDASMTKFDDGKGTYGWLNEEHIERKHNLLQSVLLAKQFGNLHFADFYHILISFQQTQKLKNRNIVKNCKNLIVLGAQDDLADNVAMFQEYYGPSFVDLLSYFKRSENNFKQL